MKQLLGFLGQDETKLAFLKYVVSLKQTLLKRMWFTVEKFRVNKTIDF